MHSIKFIVFLGAVTLIFQFALYLWAGSIYTWTDKTGAVHITETPPPPGAAVEDALSNPPESPGPVQPIPPQSPQSIGNREVQPAEPQERQAQEQLEAARQKAAEADPEAQQTIRPSE